MGLSGHGRRCGCDHLPEDMCSGCFRAFFDSADEVYDVAAPAGSEAVPQAACQMSPESGGVVAAVQGAWACQLVAVVFEPAAKVVDFKYPADAHLLFQIFKELLAQAVSPAGKWRESWRKDFAFPFPGDCIGGAGKETAVLP